MPVVKRQRNSFIHQQTERAGKRNDYHPATGSLMRFYQHSPYLCEAFHVLATSSPDTPGPRTGGQRSYLRACGLAWLQRGWPHSKTCPSAFPTDARVIPIDYRTH